MKSIQEAIKKDKFPEFVKQFAKNNFPDGNYPEWARNALKKVGIDLLQDWNTFILYFSKKFQNHSKVSLTFDYGLALILLCWKAKSIYQIVF